MIPVVQGQTPYFEHNHPKYKCCCRCCHVKTGTWILVLFGLLGVVYGMFGPSQKIMIPDVRERNYTAQEHTNLSLYWVNATNGTEGQWFVKEVLTNVTRLGLHVNWLGNVIELDWLRYCYIGGAICNVCALIALIKEKHCFLIPYQIDQVFGMVILVIALVALLGAGILFGDDIKDWLISTAVTYNAKISASLINTVANFVWGYMLFWLLLSLLIQLWLFSVVRGCYRYFKDLAEWKKTAATTLPQTVQYIPGGGYPQQQVKQ